MALTDREVVQFVLLLLVAGNETTTNLIGNAVHALLDHPDQLRAVAADPALVPALVEEALRYDSPVQVVFRTATRDIELRGVRIPAGAFVAAFLGSANRDERRFPDPDRFDVARDPAGFPASASASTSASARRSRGSRRASRSRRSCPSCRGVERAERTLARVDSFLVRGPKRMSLHRRGMTR